MTDHSLPVGRVLRSSTASLTLGTKTLATDVPRFGGFVKVAAPDGGDIIGLIYDVVIEDDLFARQLDRGRGERRNTSPINARIARCRSRSACWSWGMRARARCISICPRSRPFRSTRL